MNEKLPDQLPLTVQFWTSFDNRENTESMHIKTRLDLIMEALQASREALEYVKADANAIQEFHKVRRALEKIATAYDAAHGTEERPG